MNSNLISKVMYLFPDCRLDRKHQTAGRPSQTFNFFLSIYSVNLTLLPVAALDDNYPFFSVAGSNILHKTSRIVRQRSRFLLSNLQPEQYAWKFEELRLNCKKNTIACPGTFQ